MDDDQTGGTPVENDQADDRKRLQALLAEGMLAKPFAHIAAVRLGVDGIVAVGSRGVARVLLPFGTTTREGLLNMVAEDDLEKIYAGGNHTAALNECRSIVERVLSAMEASDHGRMRDVAFVMVDARGLTAEGFGKRTAA